ncbi:class I SAM-dependent methyltransferase [Fodinicola feengrottensis]|uniref:hypothetical protein n=1 Tax=Fodinicola feengrottensis TaxID=435914 RepID=UPI002442E89A|nr:hypothetical protein [Fodinicola feengrottensis]
MNCSFHGGKAEPLDAADGTLNVVLSSLAVHHIPENSAPRPSPRCGGCSHRADWCCRRISGRRMGDWTGT